jgi:AmmeMemoRadiSam system protein A
MSPPSDSSPLATTHPNLQAEYTLEERKLLLETAHEAILSALEGRTISLSTTVPHLSEPRGAFTTLYYEGKLRGCVGYPTALLPLFQTVIETSRAAAFDDPRFMPVTLDQARDLVVAISVLSPVNPISAADIELGRHGLIISDGGKRGLLLPQVPLEHGWNRITFLEQTCWKAGLPLDAWKTGARIEAFTAEVFGDAEVVG